MNFMNSTNDLKPAMKFLRRLSVHSVGIVVSEYLKNIVNYSEYMRLVIKLSS